MDITFDSVGAKVRSVGRVMMEGRPRSDPRCTGSTPNTDLGGRRSVGAGGQCSRVPLLRGRKADRRHRIRTQNGAALDQEADRVGHDLRRPGGDRDRERAAVRRGAGAHSRSRGITGATDGDIERSSASSAAHPANRQPVFQAMLENAARICEAKFGTLFRYDGEFFLSNRLGWHSPHMVDFSSGEELFAAGY